LYAKLHKVFRSGGGNMLISCGYDILLNLYADSTVLMALHIHPSREKDIVDKEEFFIEPSFSVDAYKDIYGNRCNRVHCPTGTLRIRSSVLVRDSGELDPYAPEAKQEDISKLPFEYLPFLLSSRYCEVDSELASFAWANFGSIPAGWARVEAISNFCHNHIQFNYQNARSNRTALDAFHEKTGVCRDFTHLAVTLCRAMSIPARYVTGYLGDIGVPPAPYPMDFSAWMEVYLDGEWYPFDPRNKERRIGRIKIAHGRDASDVAITTVFGCHDLVHFNIHTDEVSPVSSER
jgi:transglutaminase-like putative cysteine protease